MQDPAAISSFAWSEIGSLLHNLWFNLGLVIAVATLFLTSLAIIPSLVSTRHLPPSANLTRLSLNLTALAIVGSASMLLFYTVDLARIIEVFWDRYWI